MKRVGTLLLALIMAFSLAMPAAAAEKATATTMRLMETEGTASVKNAAGKTLSLKNNMRLYNGYEVATKAKSYAYISLDSSKAVKLDASSTGEIAKSGRQLELKLTAGKMFFNVPVALESDESMEIRTSTMMMGIRGTAGWVEVLDRYTTRVGVLEGMVTIHSQHPLTGADRSVTITGGQTATIIRHERAQAMMQELIRQGVIVEDNIVEELTEIGQIVEELREDGIPGFAAAEVADDTDLRQRINEESPLDADKIAQNAAARLAADEAKAKQEAEEAQDNTTTVGMKNLFGEVRTEVVTQTTTVTVKEPGETVTEYVSNVLDAPDNSEVWDALDHFSEIVVRDAKNLDVANLDLQDGETVYLLNGTITVPASNLWEVKGGTLVCTGGVQIINRGTITISAGTLQLDHGSELLNDGDVYVLGGSGTNKLILNGTIHNLGQIFIGYSSEFGQMLIGPRGELYNESIDYLDADSELGYASGTVIVEGENRPLPAMLTMEQEDNTQTNESNVLINQGAIYNYSSFVNAGSFQNEGLFMNNEGYTVNEEIIERFDTRVDYSALYGQMYRTRIECSGSVENYGEMINSGRLENYSGWNAYYKNAGEIENSGVLKNDGYFYNVNGTITATGEANSAFEQCSGYLSLQGGTISAAGNAITVYYSGGDCSAEGGEIIHTGSGTRGCALYLANNQTVPFAGDCVGLIKAASQQGLIGIRKPDPYMEFGECLTHSSTPAIPAIITLRYRVDGYYPYGCFHYEYDEALGETPYVIDMEEIHSYEVGPV